jgi:hypothetical protein
MSQNFDDTILQRTIENERPATPESERSNQKT